MENTTVFSKEETSDTITPKTTLNGRKTSTGGKALSEIYIPGLVASIHSKTTAYTPLIEAIVNGIQAIEEKKEKDGSISITIHRSSQEELDRGLKSIIGFSVEDNGIGFNEGNRKSFNTLHSNHKLGLGGKGFGRFIWLKYYQNIDVDSYYASHNGEYKVISFKMGKQYEVIVNVDIQDTKKKKTGTKLILSNMNNDFNEKKLLTIAKKIVEKLLPYFIDKEYQCPKITLIEENKSTEVVLNDFCTNKLFHQITQVPLKQKDSTFSIDAYTFSMRVLKIYSPDTKKSKISLVAHRREVTQQPLYNYIPDTAGEFFETDADGTHRNYIFGIYVFGPYLDEHVELERGGFDFGKKEGLLHPIGGEDIEKKAAQLLEAIIANDVTPRREKKKNDVRSYIEKQAPWYMSLLEDINLDTLSYQASEQETELFLYNKQHEKDLGLKKKIQRILNDPDTKHFDKKATEISGNLSQANKDNLARYVGDRRYILDLLRKKLAINEDGKYEKESAVHDIIFPRRTSSQDLPYNHHHLWLIDERLNFTRYVSSDNAIDKGNTDRADLVAYGVPVLFRGENEQSNPVTIFEFKRPQEDKFANPKAKKENDPIEQISRYTNKIRQGKFKTFEGGNIKVGKNTPFYGYIICDLTNKVKDWLYHEKEFKEMPDGEGWFRHHSNINLYTEVMSWDKVLHDAEMRNEIFFKKLGIA